MKFILSLIIIIFFSLNCKSQDTIVLRNGAKIKAKVLEVNASEVKYQIIRDEENSIYTLNKSEVSIIKYPNGTEDFFNFKDDFVKNKFTIGIAPLLLIPNGDRKS